MTDFFKEVTQAMLKKSLYITLIAIIFGLSAIVFTPVEVIALQKLGKLGYFCLIFFCAFVTISLIVWVAVFIKKKYNASISCGEINQQALTVLYETITNLYDSSTPADRKLLDYFVDNGNTPYREEGKIYRTGGLLASQYVVKTEYYESVKENPSMNEIVMGMATKTITLYKLKQEFYEALVVIKNKYGSLSKF